MSKPSTNTSSDSPESAVPKTEHNYQTAKGCLIMLAIAGLVLGITIMLMYFFGQPANATH